MSESPVIEELSLIVDSLFRFVDAEVLPLASTLGLTDGRSEYNDQGQFRDDVLAGQSTIRQRSAEAGFYTLFGSRELGGGGLNTHAQLMVFEELYRRYGPPHPLITNVVLPSAFTNGLSPVVEFLSPDLLQRYRDEIASGRATLCFALSEPDAGSDVFALRTRARRTNTGWSLAGTKQWITNGVHADYGFVFAVTDPEAVEQRRGGISAFFVDLASEGCHRSPVGGLMGSPGSDLGVIVFEDVFVPDDHVVGDLHDGLKIALTGISRGRLSLAGTCVGMARWALETTLAYSQERRTFGRPIGDHQAIQMLLADAAIDIFAAKSMAVRVAHRVDEGARAVKELSMVKAFATEMLFRVADTAIQVHGAAGLTNELGLEEVLRYARVLRVPDGTGEIQRRTVARELLKGRLEL